MSDLTEAEITELERLHDAASETFASDDDEAFHRAAMAVLPRLLSEVRRSRSSAPPPEGARRCPLCNEPDNDMHHVFVENPEPGRACIKGQGWRPSQGEPPPTDLSTQHQPQQGGAHGQGDDQVGVETPGVRAVLGHFPGAVQHGEGPIRQVKATTQGGAGSPVEDNPGPTPSAPVGGGHAPESASSDPGNVAEPQRDPASAPHRAPAPPLPSAAYASAGNVAADLAALCVSEVRRLEADGILRADDFDPRLAPLFTGEPGDEKMSNEEVERVLGSVGLDLRAAYVRLRARLKESGHDLPPAAKCDNCGLLTPAEPDRASGIILCGKCRPKPEGEPGDETKPECRIFEYDGAFKCTTHHRTWGATTNPDQPCAPGVSAGSSGTPATKKGESDGR